MNEAMTDALLLSANDNVCVAVRPLPSGHVVRIGNIEITLPQDVQLGAKIAVRPLGQGEKVLKYGAPIGSTKCSVAAGEHVHTHNLESDYLHTYRRGERHEAGQEG